MDLNTLRYTNITTLGPTTLLNKQAWNYMIDAVQQGGGSGVTTTDTPIASSTVTFPTYMSQYGSPSSPQSGNITVTPAAEATFYSVAYMWHNDSSVPSISGAVEISSFQRDYTLNSDNLISIVYLPSGTVAQVVTQPSSPPTILSATVENAADTQVVVNMSEPVLFSVDGFTVNPGKTINSINGSGTSTITLTLSASITNGESLTLEYDATVGDVVNTGGTALETIPPLDAISITNNVEPSSVIMSDNFDDNSVDLAKWNFVQTVDADTSVAESGQLLTISNAASATVTNFAENRFVSVLGTETGTTKALYTYVGSSSFARRNAVFFGVDENNYGAIYSSGAVLNAEVVIAGTQEYNFNSLVAKDQSVRISYDHATGNWLFDYWDGAAWSNWGSTTQSLAGDKYGGVAIISGGSFSSSGSMDDFYLSSNIGYATLNPV